MKILHVVYDFRLDCFRGGIAKMVYELARQQAACGHEVSVFTPSFHHPGPAGKFCGGADDSAALGGRPRGNSSEGSRVALQNNGVNIYTPQSLCDKNVTSCIAWLAHRHDVVHGHNTYLSLNRHIAAATRSTGIPIFYHVHGTLDPKVVNMGTFKPFKKRAYICLIERRNLNAARTVFALTPFEKRQLRYWGVRAPIVVMPNGIEPVAAPSAAAVGQFRRQYPQLDGARIVLFMGCIRPKKSLELLVEAFADIAPRFPNARLLIAGDQTESPPYVWQLKERIRRLHICDRVIWTGAVNEAQKRAVLDMADIFSHVSLSEGMAMAVLEAMSVGVATIVSPGCYMDVAVAAEAALLSPYNASALSERLRCLLSDEMLRHRLGCNAHRHVVTHHDWRHISRRIAACYRAGDDARTG